MSDTHAGCNCAVMTGTASAENLGVINNNFRGPCLSCVTAGALIGAIDVSQVLPCGSAAIMAALAVTRCLFMAEVGG